MLLLLLALFSQSGHSASIQIEVRSAGAPVAGAAVSVARATRVTDANGLAVVDVAPGRLEITVLKEGYVPATTSLVAVAGRTERLVVNLDVQPTHEEEVIVGATRTGKRV